VTRLDRHRDYVYRRRIHGLPVGAVVTGGAFAGGSRERRIAERARAAHQAIREGRAAMRFIRRALAKNANAAQ